MAELTPLRASRLAPRAHAQPHTASAPHTDTSRGRASRRLTRHAPPPRAVLSVTRPHQAPCSPSRAPVHCFSSRALRHAHCSFERLPLLHPLRLRSRGPLHVGLVPRCAFLPEARVHVHEELLDVERQPVHRAIPVLGGVGLQRGVQNGQNDVTALGNERDDVLVIPEEQRPLRHLEVGGVDAARDEAEEGLRNLAKLGGLRELQQLLELVEEHHLLARVGVRPVLDEPPQDVVGQLRVLL
mmetsp:Transcript_11553/g.28001  ORF Transcript_11553/g.28001 Transcript_11553/m.28001 type:complete len:241 (+) Transcript_11553:166-888(+)